MVAHGREGEGLGWSVWIGAFEGLNGAYLEGFVGLDRVEVWRELRLLFWVFG